MASDKKSSVLRRMTTEVRAPSQQPSVTEMLRLALEQSSDRELALPLDGQDCQFCLLTRDKLVDQFPAQALFAVMEGQVPGFLALELPVFGGIVEHQTIGRILSPTQSDRRPTRVDAALVAPFVDAALTRFSRMIQSAGITPWGQGMGFGAMVPDARALLLALPVRAYHVFSIEVRLCNGQRRGKVVFGFGDLPEVEEDPIQSTETNVARQTLRACVLSCPATFDAVIARLSVPLQDLQSLKTGETLEIPADALRQTRLEAMGAEHAINVTLGQLNGFRAVRLRETGHASQQPAGMHDEIEATAEEMPAKSTPKRLPPASEEPEVSPPAQSRLESEITPEPGDLDALLDQADSADLLTPV